ncbi:hypothetical protein [Priestia flexa]|uniref:hypothetical protein n=1 Tax=Priestia flexa TaxID=86664 RepID=UPI002492B6BE|nr:hypothetical protein [Priestia flexa]
MKLLKTITILFLALMSVTSTRAFAEEATQENQNVTVQSIKHLVITLPESSDSSLIDMYENGGWEYNPTTNQLQKPVTYEGLEIEVDNKVYNTDENGVVSLSTEKNAGEEVTIESEQLSASEKDVKESNQKLSTTADVSDETVVVEEYINLNHLLNSMGDGQTDEVTDEEAHDATLTQDEQVGELKAAAPYLDNKQLPSRGRAIHCNRFNGYLGDGRYYSNEASPSAIRNFFQSDCDVSLARSTKCYADYGSNPYCAAKPSTKNGHCGVIVGHARGYHKHTGWFSPSK